MSVPAIIVGPDVSSFEVAGHFWDCEVGQRIGCRHLSLLKKGLPTILFSIFVTSSERCAFPISGPPKTLDLATIGGPSKSQRAGMITKTSDLPNWSRSSFHCDQCHMRGGPWSRANIANDLRGYTENMQISFLVGRKILRTSTTTLLLFPSTFRCFLVFWPMVF